jgi:hypothetical protein
MLIIDLNNKTINQSTISLDSVIIRGASPELISSLQSAVSNATSAYRKNHAVNQSVKTHQRVPAVNNYNKSKKVSIARDVPHTNTHKVKCCGSKQKCSTNTKHKNTYTPDELRGMQADALLNNAHLVEKLRKKVSFSNKLNPADATVTTLNILTALSLLAFYEIDDVFSSTEAVCKVSDHVAISTDTLARIGSELGILVRRGAGSATRYSVSSSFADLVCDLLSEDCYMDINKVVSDLQNQIDNQ